MTNSPTVVDPIQPRLTSLTRESPDLAPIAELYLAIVPLLRDASMRVEPIKLTQDQARIKLQAGLPLLDEINLAVDEQSFCDLMLRLACAIEAIHPEKHRSLFSRQSQTIHGDLAQRQAAARQIRLALEQNKIDSGALLSFIAANDRERVALLAQSLQLDANLFWSISQNAFKSALRAWAKQLASFALDTNWTKSYCFICGAEATFAELQGNDQEKHLRCGQCGADWRFPRLKCVFCDNEDPQMLGQLFPEIQKARMRIEVCNKCHGYLKVISAFSPTPVDLIAIEDLATLHLDYIAQNRGYSREAVG